MTQQDKEQSTTRLETDELTDGSTALESSTRQPAATGDETTLLGVPEGAPLAEGDFDGLDQLPELEEVLPQPLDDVFEGAADQTRLISGEPEPDDADAQVTSGLASEGLDRTLAYQDDRHQTATGAGTDAQAVRPVPDGTARIASIDDTQLRPYAIDPHEGERVEAADVIDSGDYGLSQEEYPHPISRLRQIVVIAIAGLLVALVAYALTSIVLHGGLRMPTSSPTTTPQASDTKKDAAAQQESAVQEEWQDEQPVEQQDLQTADEGDTTPAATPTEETETTAAEADAPTPADDTVDATEVESTEAAEPSSTGEVDVAPVDEEQVADAAVEAPSAEAPEAEVAE